MQKPSSTQTILQCLGITKWFLPSSDQYINILYCKSLILVKNDPNRAKLIRMAVLNEYINKIYKGSMTQMQWIKVGSMRNDLNRPNSIQ